MNDRIAADLAPFVRRDVDARGVVTLTLDRPQSFNALSEGMLTALQGELDAIAADETARAVVIAATGKAFCAGHDLKEMRAEPSLPYYEALFAQCARMMLTIQRLPVPVIARVQGIATAAGCQLVAACDLAVAADSARFAVSGVNLGLFCSSPSVPLTRNVARKPAFEMLVTGEFISADEARIRGLVNRVASMEALDGAVESLVAAIVAKPRSAIALGKALFYRQIESGSEAAYDDAAKTMASNMMEADRRRRTRADLARARRRAAPPRRPSSLARVRPLSTTRRPAPARPRAIARPRPEPAPVTRRLARQVEARGRRHRSALLARTSRRRRGPHAAHGTGERSGLPAKCAVRLPKARSAIAWRVCQVALPMCGVRTTLSSASSSLGTCGSFSNTSSPAPAIVPSRRAPTSACSSTTEPRATLTR
jgi:enoyl-CoA hydratase/carnithine racemase